MTIGTVTAPASGATFSVPINVANFTSVGSVTLKIAYNPAVATFTGVANAPTNVTFTSNAANGVITLIWYDATGTTPLTIASGKLVDLNFTFVAGSGAITFNSSQCEVTTATGAVITGVTYNNGGINSATSTTMTLGTVTPSAAGAAVSVPINVTNLTSVGSVTLKITYNPAVVTFTGVANAPTNVTFTSNAANGVITLIWYDATGTTPLTIASGKLVDLNFTYIAGSGAITFNSSQCEVTTATGAVITGVTYNNGSINSATSTTMTLGTVTPSAAGAVVSVPVNVTNLTSVGSVTLKIAYNPAIATFTGVANAPTNVTFTSNAANGVITLIWYDATGTTPLTIASGKLVDLNFTYIAGSGAVTFNSSQCEVTTATGAVINGVTYNNGSINSITFTTITLGAVTAPASGATFSVPINVANLISVGSVTLKIAYNPAVATFTGVANAPTNVTFTSNAANGVITLIWYDATGTTPLTIASGKLVDLNFTYLTGSGTFTFNTAQCEVTTATGLVISGITYTNGSLTSIVSTTISIGSVTAPAAGAAVSVPINVKNLTSVGSVTLKIAYNPAIVTFTGVANAPTNVTFTSNAASGVITLIWYDATGTTPLTIANGKLVDLNFTYIAGSGTFSFNTAQCEVTTGSGVVISGISYISGNISNAAATTMTLGTVKAIATNSAISIPITVTNLTSIGSITLKIAYNPAIATFTGVANAPTNVTFTSNAASGVITLIWYDATGTTPLTVASGKLVDLNFTYLTGSGTFTFNTAQCEITFGTGSISSNVVYYNGAVTMNHKPVFTAITSIAKVALDTVKFTVNATDVDSTDVLTYTYSGLPSGAKFDSTRTFFWVPATSQVGTFSVKFVVSDGQLKDSMTVSITISKKPMIVKNPIADMILTDAARTIKIKLSSPTVFVYNMGTLTYSVTSANTGYVLASIILPDTLKIQGIRTTPQDVSILITVTATDTDKSTISTTFKVVDKGTTGVTKLTIPTEFSLSQNYPNPFNPTTSINFGLQAPVTMEIYNILGVKVRTLIHGEVMGAGVHQMEWNGKDDAGSSVTSGVYLYRIDAGTFQMTKKMMMLK
jgi:hypothetical protein